MDSQSPKFTAEAALHHTRRAGKKKITSYPVYRARRESPHDARHGRGAPVIVFFFRRLLFYRRALSNPSPQKLILEKAKIFVLDEPLKAQSQQQPLLCLQKLRTKLHRHWVGAPRSATSSSVARVSRATKKKSSIDHGCGSGGGLPPLSLPGLHHSPE